MKILYIIGGCALGVVAIGGIGLCIFASALGHYIEDIHESMGFGYHSEDIHDSME